VPTSWTPNGCGSAISKAAADIDLPVKHLVSLFPCQEDLRWLGSRWVLVSPMSVYRASRMLDV
jgi:hypothetical protein